MVMDVGRVAALRRYPLRSAGGEALETVEVTGAGLAQDRRWQLVDEAGALTAREVPGLRDVTATVAAGRLTLAAHDPHDPDGAGGPGTGAAVAPDAALSALAGRQVRLSDTGASPRADAAAVHLVSVGAEADPGAPAGCDPQPRANLLLDLAGPPGAERAWPGRRLLVGDSRTGAVLRVTRTPRRCLGVYAEVDRPGTVARGDVVTLLDA